MIRRIVIDIVPHTDQRYDTAGDWAIKGDILQISVSRMDDARSELAVAIHELVEAFGCEQAGIKEEDVLAFDLDFERNRRPGDFSEPGNDPRAPYRRQHAVATEIEREVIEQLWASWREHEARVNSLFQ